jgi:hypothetical protein
MMVFSAQLGSGPCFLSFTLYVSTPSARVTSPPPSPQQDLQDIATITQIKRPSPHLSVSLYHCFSVSKLQINLFLCTLYSSKELTYFSNARRGRCSVCREYCMIYRGPGFLAVILFGSSLTPPPISHRKVVSLSRPSCTSPAKLTDGR